MRACAPAVSCKLHVDNSARTVHITYPARCKRVTYIRLRVTKAVHSKCSRSPLPRLTLIISALPEVVSNTR